MTQLLSYHSDPAIKQTFLDRVNAHTAADEIVKGKYWESGKGCAVGCTIHGSDHKAYETEIGLPTWLAHLEDRIFENLPNEEAKTFPAEFLQAIPIGVALEPVRSQFCAFLMRENIEQVATLRITDDLKMQVIAAVRGVLVLHESAAWSAAWSAARSAESAAESAAWSAWSAARSAESAAGSAAWSAESAAESAESAAGSAAWSAAWSRYKLELLRLLRDA